MNAITRKYCISMSMLNFTPKYSLLFGAWDEPKLSFLVVISVSKLYQPNNNFSM